MKQMKFMLVMILTMVVSACVGGEIQVENPCEEGYVLTGGWTGEWSTGDQKCVPEGDMGPNLDMNNHGNNHANHTQNNNPDMSSNNQTPNNTTPNNAGNNDNPGHDMGCTECPVEDMNPEDMSSDMDSDMGMPCTEGDCCDDECCGYNCPPVCEDPVESHRIVGIILQLTNPDVPTYKAKKLTRNAVKWVSRSSNCADVKVLVVLDDDHHNEFMGDAAAIKTWLESAGYAVDFMLEPSSGLTSSDVHGYDVVWFTNPGWPVDDSQTLHVLHEFADAGGGLVLSGDDMSQNGTTPLLHLNPLRNGTQTCGVPTDNNIGKSYKVALKNISHPVLKDLEGASFYYANDIDHSEASGYGEGVLATAKLDPRLNCNCDLTTPVIIVKDVPGYCRAQTCTADDGHPRVGIGYGHCINAENPGHSKH